MEYGKLQGEISAAAHITVSGEVPAASIVGTAFNVQSASLISTGLYAVALGDGVDKNNCAVIATADLAPNTVSANNSGADTDTVKRFAVVDAAGAVANGGFYFYIARTAVG